LDFGFWIGIIRFEFLDFGLGLFDLRFEILDWEFWIGIIGVNLIFKPIINLACSRVSIPLASPLNKGDARILFPLVKRDFDCSCPPLKKGG
jgi:hypothetical protein